MSEKVYFEKQRAIDEAKHTPFFDDRDAATALELIRSIPPADVKPVVRGEWMEPEGSECVHAFAGEVSISLPSKKCSVCGHLAVTFPKSNFCPNCGAAMTEEAVRMLKERGGENG